MRRRLGSVNPRTGKPFPDGTTPRRTINHQLSVLFGFYEHACAAGLGPLVNPVPAQRGRDGGRVFAHHNPMEDFVLHRRATYRQKTPKPTWRAIPDDAAEQLFGALRCHRDRALVSFWLSSGARAAELLGLRHGDLDVGAHTITVVSKGSRARETIPASVDSFVWLALYLAEEQPPLIEGGPVWWTRQGTSARPLTYHAARAVLQRANSVAGHELDAARPAAHRRATAARRPGVHPGRRPDDPAARERDHHPDLHPAPAGGPREQGAGAPCSRCPPAGVQVNLGSRHAGVPQDGLHVTKVKVESAMKPLGVCSEVVGGAGHCQGPCSPAAALPLPRDKSAAAASCPAASTTTGRPRQRVCPRPSRAPTTRTSRYSPGSPPRAAALARPTVIVCAPTCESFDGSRRPGSG